MVLRVFSRHGRASPPYTRAVKARRLLSSAPWSPATVQEKVNTHPGVADCCVEDACHLHGVEGVIAHIVPYWKARGNQMFHESLTEYDVDTSKAGQQAMDMFADVNSEGLHEYLQGEGYSGPPLPVLLCSETQLVANFYHGDERHKRLVLRDIIAAIFAACDTDDDGAISLEELINFVAHYQLKLNASKAFLESDSDQVVSFAGIGVGGSDDLDFGEFKQLLLKERMISVGDGDGRYTVADSLIDLVSHLIFHKADTDGDGEISLAEITAVLAAYSLEGDAPAVFGSVDTNGDGLIDIHEFKGFLLSEGVLSTGSRRKGDDSGLFDFLFG